MIYACEEFAFSYQFKWYGGEYSPYLMYPRAQLMTESNCGQPCGDEKVVEGLIVVAEARIWPCELCHHGVAAAVNTPMLVSAIRVGADWAAAVVPFIAYQLQGWIGLP